MRAERTALGWTLGRLSYEAAVPSSMVELIERGRGEKRSPASNRKVSAALGWTPESLEALGRHGRGPERMATTASATTQVIYELAAQLTYTQQRLVEAHVRYLLELNSLMPGPANRWPVGANLNVGA